MMCAGEVPVNGPILDQTAWSVAAVSNVLAAGIV
jgi:hypothetical protein